MCTSISFNPSNHNCHYFGRNLDVTHSYNEEVIITPRNFPFYFLKHNTILSHYAIIGIGTVIDNFPLYFDATNEAGLSIAGLNFPNNAQYRQYEDSKTNITPFELIPWILSSCANIDEVKILLKNFNPLNVPFNDLLPLTPLHWHIADRYKSITLECTEESINIFDNPVNVLTNNPPFNIQLFNLNNYMHLSKSSREVTFSTNFNFDEYSAGMGGMGLPGDFSSMSRFVKAFFLKTNMECITEKELTNISKTKNICQSFHILQFFHILSAVSQPFGCILLDNSEYEYTLYSSCCDTINGIYHYTTYINPSITSVNLHNHDLNSNKLISYSLNYTSLL